MRWFGTACIPQYGCQHYFFRIIREPGTHSCACRQGDRGTAVMFVHEQLDLVLHIVEHLSDGFVVQLSFLRALNNVGGSQ
jgi:hypothetical protein